jgi:thiopurine S-methyltransferase
MDASTSTTAVSPAHPNLQLWDKLYEAKKDEWTSEKVDKEVFKFYDVLVNGSKTGLAILVPMCGKSRIMLWFAERGHRVVGIEWSELAVKQFFEENGLAYSTKSCRIGGIEMSVYTGHDIAITIYCGDLFAFKEDNLGGFDCIFDHGSIGSFDFTDIKRTVYADLMNAFTKPGGRMVISFFDYEHSEHPIVPFAVTEEEVTTLYKEHFNPPQLLQEYNAKQTAELFDLKEGSIFPVWTFSRHSWKVALLIKISA